jgi:hypothetical protein
MTDEQINAAISAVYGWDADYCACLNAMHEAESAIFNAFAPVYAQQLVLVTRAESCGDREFYCATARQRAEAFLRTLGKWEGGQR